MNLVLGVAVLIATQDEPVKKQVERMPYIAEQPTEAIQEWILVLLLKEPGSDVRASVAEVSSRIPMRESLAPLNVALESEEDFLRLAASRTS